MVMGNQGEGGQLHCRCTAYVDWREGETWWLVEQQEEGTFVFNHYTGDKEHGRRFLSADLNISVGCSGIEMYHSGSILVF